MPSPLAGFEGLVKGSSTFTFVPNPAGIIAAGATPLMELALYAPALQIISLAQTIAGMEAFDTGDYYDGLDATHGIDYEGIPTAYATASAFDFKSAWIEYGSIHNSAHHILTRASEAAGFKVKGGRQ